MKGFLKLYPTAILHNKTKNRWHPMPFRVAPRPSENLEVGKILRHKSMGHHTEGFGSLEEAKQYIADSEQFEDTGVVYLWDEDGRIPATVGYFVYK